MYSKMVRTWSMNKSAFIARQNADGIYLKWTQVKYKSNPKLDYTFTLGTLYKVIISFEI